MSKTSVEPGAVNAHTHLYSGLAPLGLPALDPPAAGLTDILRRRWWRLDRALDADLLDAAARYAVADALLAGTTTLIDHHESPASIECSLDVIADACAALGARAVLTYGATERNDGAREAERGLAECARFVEENTRPHISGLVGLHAAFTVSDATIERAAGLARELGRPLHLHLAEDEVDDEDARGRGYAGVLDRLDRLGALVPGSVFAHGVRLEEEAVARLCEAGVWLVQNPRSNLGNGVGYPKALHASDRVALGTDGHPADMREEGRVLREQGAAHGEGEDALAPRTTAGHRLAEDLLAPSADEEPDTVLRVDGRVDRVTVAGRVVVEGGRLALADEKEILRRAEKAAPRLWKKMGEIT